MYNLRTDPRGRQARNVQNPVEGGLVVRDAEHPGPAFLVLLPHEEGHVRAGQARGIRTRQIQRQLLSPQDKSRYGELLHWGGGGGSLPYFGKKKQVTYHLNLELLMFLYFTPCALLPGQILCVSTHPAKRYVR